jgi:tRNA dimethylallyltransferase
MAERANITVLAIVGPTASGKSAIAIRLAERLGGEIVSADSMMVYRGMDIGTAKPPPLLRDRIPHRMIDIVDPEIDFSVAEYQPQARAAIEDIASRGLLPIVVGGTGLYVSGAVDNLRFPTDGGTSYLREKLKAEADEFGSFHLHEKLQRLDPAAASSIHINNVRRVIRALEVYELTGEKYSEAGTGFKSRKAVYDVAFAGIEYGRDELYRRINVRTDRMLLNGWADEVRRLFADGRVISKTAAKAIGYLQLKKHIDGEITIEAAADLIKIATRRYAKRQMTWFNADQRITWFRPMAGPDADDPADAIELFLRRQRKAE